MRSWSRRRRALSCEDVAVVLQQYIDDETDEVTAARVRDHLADCVRCGMEQEVYVALKASLARRAALDAEALARLRAFGARLAEDAASTDTSSA